MTERFPNGCSEKAAAMSRLSNMTNLVKSARMTCMRTVKIGDLKAHLSAHLKRVKQGEEVLVCDRDEPVARIVPCNLQDFSEQDKHLIARGIMTPPLKRWDPRAPLPEPAGNVSDEVMEQVWREERGD